MHSSFKRNLVITFFISLFLLLASSVASFISIRNMLRSQDLVTQSHNVITKMKEVLVLLRDAETGQRGFLLTGEQDFLQPYFGAGERAMKAIDEAAYMTIDNYAQQRNLEALRDVTNKRLLRLQEGIDEKKAGRAVSLSALKIGKSYMDQARELVNQMEQRENFLLNQATAKMNRFAATTPLLIVVASLLSILVAVVSFLRVNKDYSERVKLQEELQKKDEVISKRLEIIEDIANQISKGDYNIRVSDEGKDVLGNLSLSLNRMAGSLKDSFNDLAKQEWLQAGIARINERMIGERNLETLTNILVNEVSGYTSSQAAAFYLADDAKNLTISAAVGLDRNKIRKTILYGEGIAGRASVSGNITAINDISETDLVITYSDGEIKPRAIIAVPIYYEGRLKGIMELAAGKDYSQTEVEYLKSVAFNIGLAIHSARDHQRLQELLHETQDQAEELQSQHAELENINAELESQAEKLQASEEELRVQQEELQQANQELEERSKLLEERNQLILQRNLDIQQKVEELAQSTRYKSEFLANMSHELRTPLNSILLLSRLLAENHPQNLSGDQIEYASVIQSSGKGLLTLIDEILDLSKIESGKMELEWQDVRIENVTDALSSIFTPMAKEKGIEFSVETAKGVPHTIESDHLRLEQVLRNLLSNALKFTRQGSVHLRISSDGKNIFFKVTDTGIGIPVDKQQTIFEAFKQADGSTRRQYGGTGLGLSISRQLARLLGGEIELSSEPEKGSEFTLVLPIEKMHAHTASEESWKPVSIEQPKSAETPVHLNGNRQFITEVIPPDVPDDRLSIRKGDRVILIIDDDTAFARSLLEYTRQQGYKGIVAVRGDDGISLAGEFLPSGILLDLQLPVKSGWDVMDELKRNPKTRPIPVHIMSALDGRTRGLSQGAIDFISKPLAAEKLSEVFQRIEHALNNHPKKVLIIEENPLHAKALAHFLETYNISSEIRTSVEEGVEALLTRDLNCVILDMGVPALRSGETLDRFKNTPGLEGIPVIIFTGKNLSHAEEMNIRKYSDSIVVKTAHSYQRVLDEVSLFLHLVEENHLDNNLNRYRKNSSLGDVLKGKTILVADDDVRNIFSLSKSLENYGVKVISAVDGKEAVKALEETSKVDLVLMDMMMPEMDGYESTRIIRSNPRFRNLPVIAVTAKAMTGDREKCISAGASDYITKPVDIDQLVSLLRVWLYNA